MKLKDGFITHTSNGEQVMVGTGATGFNGLIRSNRTAAFIVDRLKEEITEEEIVKAMCENFEVSEETAKKDICMILEKLQSIGALND